MVASSKVLPANSCGSVSTSLGTASSIEAAETAMPPPPSKQSITATAEASANENSFVVKNTTSAAIPMQVTSLGTPSPLAVSICPKSAMASANKPAKSTQKHVSIAVPATSVSKTKIVKPGAAVVPQRILSSATTAKIGNATGTSRVVPKYLSNTASQRVGTSSSTVTATTTRQITSTTRPAPVGSMHHSHHIPSSISPPPPSSSHHLDHNIGYTKKKSGHPLRRGKWTSEEEAYANRLIEEFKSGLLPLTDGTTLRNFLSKLLNCDPMRISKKFVGNNCIGKQVFRRRVAEINQLTSEQILQIRVDLSELERRFFDRVAQTNRVKAPGVSMSTGIAPGNGHLSMIRDDRIELETKAAPPWLRPPKTYKPKGKFAEKALARHAPKAAVLHTRQITQKVSLSSTPPLVDVKYDTEKAMEAIQRSGNSFNHLAKTSNDVEFPRTPSALEHLARTASAAKFVEDIVNGEDPIDTETQTKTLSKATLQGSFEALMSMDIHSVENLVELAATSNSSAILSELNKNYSDSLHRTGSMSNRMESFIKSLSNANLLKSGLDSQQALGDLLHNSSNFFDADKISKIQSSTGFSQLRAEDGLANGPHGSVDDFLSLVASGDIPHQDPNMLQVPLQKVMQPGMPKSGSKRRLSQQELAALSSHLAGSSAKLNEAKGGGGSPKRPKKRTKKSSSKTK